MMADVLFSIAPNDGWASIQIISKIEKGLNYISWIKKKQIFSADGIARLILTVDCRIPASPIIVIFSHHFANGNPSRLNIQ